tara:strand:- start:130 stop:441 length:312 start_codon:yes stop_codon:yes gene_type:complete
MKMPSRQQLEAIDHIHAKFWTAYGANYLLTTVIGLNRAHERSDLMRTALAETQSQYAKSRVAVAWAYLNLELNDQIELLQDIQMDTRLLPLKWSCERVLKQMS